MVAPDVAQAHVRRSCHARRREPTHKFPRLVAGDTEKSLWFKGNRMFIEVPLPAQKAS